MYLKACLPCGSHPALAQVLPKDQCDQLTDFSLKSDCIISLAKAKHNLDICHKLDGACLHVVQTSIGLPKQVAPAMVHNAIRSIPLVSCLIAVGDFKSSRATSAAVNHYGSLRALELVFKTVGHIAHPKSSAKPVINKTRCFDLQII